MFPTRAKRTVPVAEARPRGRPMHPADGGDCREYTREAVIGGERQQTHAATCRQPDRSWRIGD